MRNIFEKLHSKLDQPQQVELQGRAQKFKIISRHPFAVPFITITCLVILTGGVYLIASQTNKLPPQHDAKIVIISHDHQQQTVPTKEATVGSLLKKLNIPLNQGDVVEPAASTPIKQDQFRVNIYRAVPVEIVDGTSRTYTFSASKTPRALAQQAGTSVFPEDNLTTVPTSDFLTSGSIGAQVIVDRATPVNVDLYGTPVVLRTHAKTVGGLIKEKHIKLIKDDRVSVPLTTPIAANQQVAFIRTGTKVETITETIATPIQTINDPSLAYGTSAVRQQGTDGQQIVTYQVQIVNNVEKSRTIIQKVVTKQAVTSVVVIGTSLSGIKGDMALAGISPSDYQYADYIISRESGWCPTKWQGEPGACPPYHGTPSAGLGYGLGQATPGSKMSAYGADWATNPVTQLKWASGYAKSRHGGWAGAYAYWLSHHNW
ncbi:MAG: G5 domain-containing protein [Patescibacteria group bacterium]